MKGRPRINNELKRRLLVQKMLKENPNISCEEMCKRLKEEHQIETTRMTIWSDSEFLKSHTLDENSLEVKETLLQLDRRKLNKELRYNEDLRKRAKKEGDCKTEALVGKLIKDIVMSRVETDKKIEELSTKENSASRPVYNVFIGQPKAVDMEKYKDRLFPKEEPKDEPIIDNEKKEEG